MRRVIKNQKKMKNTMYIVFWVFALALFGITMLNPSYAEEWLIIDDALDAIMQWTEMYGSWGFEKVEEEKMILPVEEDEGEDEDVVESEVTPVEEIEEWEGEDSQDLDDVDLEWSGGDAEENVDETVEDKGQTEEYKEEIESWGDDINVESYWVTDENENNSTETVSTNDDFNNSGFIKPEIQNQELQSSTKTIKFHPNWWAFSWMNIDEIKEVTYTKNANWDYIPDINLQFPNRNSENMSQQSWWMFAWWYTTSTNQTTEWLWMVSDTTSSEKTVYAKWLPFNDLKIQVWDISFVIMDRNMWAEDVAQWNHYSESLSKVWYYYQWWNNYWFKNDSLPLNSWTSAIFDASLWWPWNYYTSSKYLKVWRYWSLYKSNFNNLWWWESWTYEAMQWPCPEWYHIPDWNEWKDIIQLFKQQTSSLCNQNESRRSCFLRRLKLPLAWWLSPVDWSRLSFGTYCRYQSSTKNNLYIWSTSDISVDWYSPSWDPIRCIKNSDSQKKKLVYVTNWWTTPQSPKKVARSWWYVETLPKSSKDWFVFVWWYTTPTFNEGTEVVNNNIESDSDTVTVYAKRRERYENITITYNANWWYFSWNAETMQVSYNEQLDWSFIPDINLQFPNRNSENISQQSWWMFAWWYIESWDSENQVTERYTQSDELNVLGNNWTKTVYAKWLPFNDFPVIIDWKVITTIMDRNLWATEISNWEWNHYDTRNEDYAKFWFYYQRWNNYGFSNTQQNKYVTSAQAINNSPNEWGPGNYYSSSNYVSSQNRRTRDDLRNLWWGENPNNSDKDKQWPCPDWYHVPDISEWKAIYDEFEKERLKNDNYCSWFSDVHLGNAYWICFASKLKLPFASHWDNPFHISQPGTSFRYQTSSPEWSSTAYHWLSYWWTPSKDYLVHTAAMPIRCFRNSDNIPLTISFDNDWIDEDLQYSLRRWNSVLQFKPNNPIRKWYQFIWWTKNNEVFEFKDNVYIAWATVVDAEWDKNPRYELNANGGYFTSWSWKEIIKSDVNMLRKVSHTPNIYDNGEKYKWFDYSSNMNDVITIKWAEKLKILLKYWWNSETGSWLWDCVAIWEGNHPNYKVHDNYESSITQKLCDYRSIQTREYEVEGDTITIGFSSDWIRSSVGVDYWYYAVISDANSEEEYIYEINDEIPTPKRNWYTFLWRYETWAIQPFDFTWTEVVQDRAFYAKWQENTYTVSFNANNGEDNPWSITVIYDSQYPELPVVNKTWYTFSWWYNGEEIVNSWDIVKITEDTTLIAKRTINQYKIIFDTDGWNEISPIEKDYNSVINITLPTPTKECNEFSWWNIELSETMPAHDIILKAIWNYTCSRSSWGWWAKKSESTTREIAIDTPTDQEHNSANEEQKSETSETSDTPINWETTHQVISVTQEVSEDGTVEAIVETVKIKNTDIVATVRTEVSSASSSSSSSSSTTHTKEQNDAYNFAKSNWITTTSSIEDAKMNTELTRIQMAKMLSNFAINVLWEEPDTEKWVVKFDDVTNKMDKQYDNAVTKAYQLWIMWQNVKDNEFRPNDEVTRGEFATALSRLLYQTEEWEYKWTGKYYIPHVAKLYNEWIINKADPKIKEKRWYVMTMLKRTVE